jgi:hypothetical protein
VGSSWTSSTFFHLRVGQLCFVDGENVQGVINEGRLQLLLDLFPDAH